MKAPLKGWQFPAEHPNYRFAAVESRLTFVKMVTTPFSLRGEEKFFLV
jgi:hypothetical protein